MAWHQTSHTMITSCQLNACEQISVKFEYEDFSFKCIWKCCLQNGNHFVQTSVCEMGNFCLWLWNWNASTWKHIYATGEQLRLI